MNLVGEIAQYAIETDQVIKELAAQRDEARALVSKLTDENRELQKHLAELRTDKLADKIHELHTVRNSDNAVVENKEAS